MEEMYGSSEVQNIFWNSKALHTLIKNIYDTIKMYLFLAKPALILSVGFF